MRPISIWARLPVRRCPAENSFSFSQATRDHEQALFKGKVNKSFTGQRDEVLLEVPLSAMLNEHIEDLCPMFVKLNGSK